MRTFDKDELQKRVNEVLFYIWDPIGVSPEPFARAEYDNYVSTVLQLLNENDNIDPISEYLITTMSSHMGLPPNKKLCDETATILLEHKAAIKEGCA